MHLNGFVDVISKAFLDIVIQPGQKPDERQAFHMMLDHFSPGNPQKYIVTADRGYESYDLLFHCELKNLNYVFRVKAPSSSKSLLSYYAAELPDDLEEFDVTMKRYFTDKATKVMKDQSDVYRYILAHVSMQIRTKPRTPSLMALPSIHSVAKFIVFYRGLTPMLFLPVSRMYLTIFHIPSLSKFPAH